MPGTEHSVPWLVWLQASGGGGGVPVRRMNVVAWARHQISADLTEPGTVKPFDNALPSTSLELSFACLLLGWRWRSKRPIHRVNLVVWRATTSPPT